jgi:succinate dehydrogenase / fumarate reductase membrane anchor subunit
MPSMLEPRSARTSVRDQPRLQRRPRVNSEVFLWYFMRISGLVLLFMALFHFAVTHIIYDVTETTSGFVASRWQNPLWRTYDWLLLALGLGHGVAGLRHIMDDYIRSAPKRAATKAFMYALVFGLFAFGTITIVTFQA